MIFAGILTSASIVVIAGRLSPKLLKRALGYAVWLDIGAHCLFIGLGAMSGTFSGVMSGLIAALCTSAVITVTKHIIGYQRYENNEWKEYPGDWNISSITRKIKNGVMWLFDTIKNGVSDGLKKENEVIEA